MLSTVSNCSSSRLEHFAKIQKRKSKFSENQKRRLSHAVGRKTKREKAEDEKKRKEQAEFRPVSGNGGPNEDEGDGKKKNESPQTTKDKGKGKATDEDEAAQERMNRVEERRREEDETCKATSQWAPQVVTGRTEKIGEEKEAGTSGGLEGGQG